MACSEANMNMLRFNHLLGETEVCVMLVGAAGAGKSSLINSVIKLVNSSDISQNKISRNIPTAKSQFNGGHTTMRESVKLTDTLSIVDNRGWHDWENKASLQELIAQIHGQRVLGETVNWNDTVKEWTSIPFTVSKKIDCIAVVLNGRLGVDEINHIDFLIETCRKNTRRRPSFVVTHKDLITDEDVEQIKTDLEGHGAPPEQIFFIRNISRESDVLDDESKACLCAFIEICIKNGKVGAIVHRQREEMLRKVEELRDIHKEKQIADAKKKLQSRKSLAANAPSDIETEVEIELLQERVNILEIERNHAQELKAVKREFSKAWQSVNQKIRYSRDENKSLQSVIRELEEKAKQSSLSCKSLMDANTSLQNELKETDLALESAEKDLKKLEQEKRQNEKELTKYEKEKISNETNLKFKEQLIEKLELHVLELKESIQKAEQAKRSQEIALTSQKQQFELHVLELRQNIQKTEQAAYQQLEKERSQNEKEQARMEEEKNVQKADLKSKEQHIEKLELHVLELRASIQKAEQATNYQLEQERRQKEKERATYEEEKRSLEIALTSQKQQFELRISELQQNIQKTKQAYQQLEKERSQSEKEQARLEEEKYVQKANLKSKEQHIEKLELHVLELKESIQKAEQATNYQLEQERRQKEKERATYEEEKRSQEIALISQEQQFELRISELQQNIEKAEQAAYQQLEKERSQNEKEQARLEEEKYVQKANLKSKEQHIEKLELHVLELKESIQKAEQATNYQHEQERRQKEKERATYEEEKRSQEIALTSQKQQFELLISELQQNIEKTEQAAYQQLEKERSQNEKEQARLEEEKCLQKTDLKSKEQYIEKLELFVSELKESIQNTETAARQELEKERTKNEKERADFEEQTRSQQKVLEDKNQCIEQLENESWKLRTKIQLESEIRLAERKREKKKPKLIRRVISLKSKGVGDRPSTDDSSDQLNESNLCEEQANDEFADILKQIADDLYDEDKIESLGGQLGILQGDIRRALMTNVKFNRVTSQGTRHMLKQWRRDVSSGDARMELRRALEAAKLKELAERYIPQDKVDEDVEQSDSADHGSREASQTHVEQTQYDDKLDPEVNKEAGRAAMSGHAEFNICRQMKESPKTKDGGEDEHDDVKQTSSRQETEGRQRPMAKDEFVASTQNSPEKANEFTGIQEQTDRELGGRGEVRREIVSEKNKIVRMEEHSDMAFEIAAQATTKNKDEVSLCQTETRELTQGKEVEISTESESVVFGKDDVIEKEGKDLSLDTSCKAENVQKRSILRRGENYKRLDEENEKCPRSNLSSSGSIKKLTPCCTCC